MKAAIFDMDGTLIDSMYYWRTVAVEYLREHGFDPPEELRRELYYVSVRSTPPIMRRYYDIPDSDEALVDFFDRRMMEHYQRDVRLKPGADRYIARLRAQGVTCALATASLRAQARPLMERLGLGDAFGQGGRELIFCSDELGVTKASDEYYPELCRRIGAAPADCVMYEDSLYSIKTARRAGLRVWAIEDETARRHRDEIITLAERYFASWDELLGEGQCNAARIERVK